MIELMNEKWKFSHKESASSNLKVTKLTPEKKDRSF